MLLNPLDENSDYFNPLYGEEYDVIDSMIKAFRVKNSNIGQILLDMNEVLIRNSIKVLKRLEGNNARLVDMQEIINRTEKGLHILAEFKGLYMDKEIFNKENESITKWFEDYYIGNNSFFGVRVCRRYCSRKLIT